MIEIGGRTFLVPTPGGMESFALQQRIIPLAGRIANVFAHLLGQTDMAKLGNMDVASALPAALPHLGAIFSEMPPGELEAITRTLLRRALCDKLPLFAATGGDAFDGLMQGRTLEVWQLLWHALEVWYPDFFARARALVARQAKVASPSEPSTTLPGDGLVTGS